MYYIQYSQRVNRVKPINLIFTVYSKDIQNMWRTYSVVLSTKNAQICKSPIYKLMYKFGVAG